MGSERSRLALIGHHPDMGIERAPVYTSRLQCVECGRVSRENERSWTARLTHDVIVYCPACGEREFRRAETERSPPRLH
ncbi:MAG TPA: hypothetical protein VFP24_04085 [Gaiellaceae bacterium]|nr:hypothetical protein [Gaiellaceae bacterium]